MFHVEQFEDPFDLIVIGAGHAGIEAVNIASQFSLRIALVTMPGVPIGSAPCNPCVGGVGKGQVVRELDALGGIIGKLADKSGIQFRTLNESKGYAVQSTRVQIDKEHYSRVATSEIQKIKNLTLIFDKIFNVSKIGGYFHVQGEKLYRSKTLVCTLGTFLNGQTHIGSEVKSGGRYNIAASNSFTSIFDEVKTLPTRFKTGTPPRLRGRSINFNKMDEQPSDDNVQNFHWDHGSDTRFLSQRSCYLTRTNVESMSIILANKERSPMYNGQIKAVGARYCPSIEDKAYRYPDKYSHHVFVEPEGLDTDSFYPSGISSSLPKDVQETFVRTIEGLENAEILQYGYAVEYDVMDTTQLDLGLQHKEISGLYFAGQVNGTSGYEEAAGQGYVAGVNAALSLVGRDPLIFNRHDSYIGVMIEDLVTSKRDEPYRLFTARTENRLFIREDNAILRMWSYRDKLGLNLGIDRFNRQYISDYMALEQTLASLKLKGSDFGPIGTSLKIDAPIGAHEIFKRPEHDPVFMLKSLLIAKGISVSPLLMRSLAIAIKYQGYIEKSQIEINKIQKLERKSIEWKRLVTSENISFECKRRIELIKPVTFGQLKRIDGIRAATLVAVASTL